VNKVSVTIITKNEEANIERCLKSLTWADEIVVADSGSKDSTVEICKKYNCNIIKTDWLGFGRTKKYAVDSAKYDWIISIDADEEITPELRDEIEKILQNPKLNGYRIKRKSFYLGKMINHCGWSNDYPFRLFNKKFGNFNEKEIHESVELKGEVGRIKSPILHYTYPTIALHIEKTNRYSSLQASELKERGKEYLILSALFLGINKFINMYFIRAGFLDGKEGFMLCSIASFGVYLKYIKLRELNKNK